MDRQAICSQTVLKSHQPLAQTNRATESIGSGCVRDAWPHVDADHPRPVKEDVFIGLIVSEIEP
jgi:hypothetical protein